MNLWRLPGLDPFERSRWKNYDTFVDSNNVPSASAVELRGMQSVHSNTFSYRLRKFYKR